MNDEEYVEVYSAFGQLQADMIRLMLEAAGLHVLTRGESAGAVYGLTVGTLGEVKVLVLQSEEQSALDFITAMEEGRLENPAGENDSSGSSNDDKIENE
jgi:hypothetical protein